MCAQKTRPIDAFQRIAASFKQFENKLDKLQEDVDYHGQTLLELRTMVTNLSGGAILAAVNKAEDNNKSSPNKSTPNQYEVRIRNKNSVPRNQPMPPKLKMKSYQAQKPKMTPQTSPFQVHGNKMELGPKGIAQKHAQRHRRADAQRKSINTIRTQKLSEKKRIREAK